MSTKIAFIKSCKHPSEPDMLLEPAYVEALQFFNTVVQVNLDLNVLIAMEKLSEKSSLEDVKRVGLYPLYELLNNAPITMVGLGVHECPEFRVPKAHEAYDRFCRKFWPKSVNDPQTTKLKVSSPPKKIKQFSDMPDSSRYFYGPTYISMLQIQNILEKYSDRTQEEQFEIYFHSMIHFIDQLHAFDTEIAKYAFWNIKNELHQKLSKKVRNRRMAIKRNFVDLNDSIEKDCLNSAMDVMHVCVGVLAEDMQIKLRHQNIEHWFATMDQKLATVCKDIYHIYNQDLSSSILISDKEPELLKFPYWQYVESLTSNISLIRKNNGYSDIPDHMFVERIDKTVYHLENQLKIR